MHLKRKRVDKLVSILYWHCIIFRRHFNCVAATARNWVADSPGWSNTGLDLQGWSWNWLGKAVQPGSCRRKHSRYGSGTGWETRGRWEWFGMKIKRMQGRDRNKEKREKDETAWANTLNQGGWAGNMNLSMSSLQRKRCLKMPCKY